MPRWPYRTLGTLLDRIFRNDLNSNFTDIASDMGEQKARVDNLITANPQPSEVVDARTNSSGKSFTVLKDRLDDSDTTSAEATGYGVISGLTISAQSTPDMTVSVTGGTVHMPDGSRFTPSSTNVTIATADATNPRIDLVYVDNAGTISVVIGTPATSPSAPVTPTGGVELAQISVSAGVTSIVSSDITDERLIKQNNNQIVSQLADIMQKGLIIDSYHKLSGEADDTGRFQRMINDSVSKGYLPCFVTEGITISDTITTPQANQQPLILGRGYKNTIINYSGIASGKSAIKFKGGSGTFAGGGVMMLGFEGNVNSIGVEFADCCGVDAYKCEFGTNLVGVLFHNESSGGFTEYCRAIKSSFKSTCKRSIEYRITSGDASFHGSGIEDGLINQDAAETEPKVLINSGCHPYNAPMSFQCWAYTTTPLIRNLNGKQENFRGDITIETTSNIEIVDSAQNDVYALGSVSSNNENLKLGKLILCDRIQLNSDGSINVNRKDFNKEFSLVTGSTSTLSLGNNEMALVDVLIYGSNYEYTYLLCCYNDPGDNNGSVVTLANPRSFNTAGYGAPTFSWSNGQLVITNANYPSTGMTAYISVKSYGSRINNFMQ